MKQSSKKSTANKAKASKNVQVRDDMTFTLGNFARLMRGNLSIYQAFALLSKTVFFLSVSTVVLIILNVVMLILLQSNHEVIERYFAVNDNGVLVKLTPVREAYKPNVVIGWGSKALGEIFTFDVLNYKNELTEARKYFVGDDAYYNFLASLKDTILNDVKNVDGAARLVVNDLSITGEDKSSGRYRWDVEGEGTIVMTSAKSGRITSSVRIYATIMRVLESENLSGLAFSYVALAPK